MFAGTVDKNRVLTSRKTSPDGGIGARSRVKEMLIFIGSPQISSNRCDLPPLETGGITAMKGKGRRKALICGLALVASTIGANAQGFSALGVKLGYSSSKFVGTDIPGKGISSQSGLTLGGYVTYELNHTFSLQQEVLFTLKGSKVNTVGDVWLSNIFLYFEMPLLAKATFLADDWLRPNVYAGPAVAVLIGAFNSLGFLENVRTMDFGLVIGGGVEIWKLSLDVRLTKGLLNFDQSAADIDRKHQMISVMMGYAF
jgi:hypothetical protein